jgi:hypothetical protein
MIRVAVLSSVLVLGCGGLAADGPSLGSPNADEGSAGDSNDGVQSVLLDEVLGALGQDLLSVNPAERRYMRYVSVSHLRNALDARADRVEPESTADIDPFAAREPGRETLRMAVLKLANSTSTSLAPHEPSVFGWERLFQRIDLRHYGWEGPIELAGQRYADGWEAIVSQALLAVEYAGPDADRSKRMSGARIPWLLADDFVAALASGEAYYELLGLPRTLTELQATMARAPEDDDPPLRAGFDTSAVSHHPRVVERRGSQNRRGAYWQALDFASASRGELIFSEPTTIVPDATEVIFSLPNGLQGYFIADAGGQRVTRSPLSNVALANPAQPDGVLRSPSSCFGCHNGGLIPFRDEVRPRLLAPGGAPLTPEQTQAALDAYPESVVLERLMARDTEYYEAVTVNAQIPLNVEDPVSRVFLGFWDDLGARQAAGELFVEPDVLQRELERLPGVLAPLRAGGTVERPVLAGAYLEAMCRLHGSSTNRPAACE